MPSATCGGSERKRLGQQREQRHAEQGADRVADQPRHQPEPEAVAEEQKHRCGRETADAAEHAETDRRRQDLHGA